MYDTFWEKLGEQDLNDNTRRILRTLSTTGTAGSEHQKLARNMLKARLQSTSRVTWTTAIRNGAEPLPTAKTLANALKRPLNAGPQLVDALNGMLPSLVADDTPSWASRWFEAAELLSPASRKAVHRYLRDRLFTGVLTAGMPGLLVLASDTFSEDSDFASRGDSTIRHIATPMLDHEAGLAWLTANIDRTRTWVSAAPADAKAFLKEQAQHRLGSADDARRKHLRAVTAGWFL